jgi:hypothetical protein
MTTTDDVTPSVRKRVVEETLGDAVAETLKGAALGASVVEAIDRFVFRDIETEDEALDVFSFIDTESTRRLLASAFRGARWIQKTGLVLARPVAHPAHAAQVRSQFIEYGSICELALRVMLEQNGTKALPNDFDGIIDKCRSGGILSKEGETAAQLLRSARNRVHLFLQQISKEPRAERDGRKAYQAMTTIINECRSYKGLPAWRFGKTGEKSPDPQELLSGEPA